MKNADNKCFTWSVLAALHPQDIHTERIAKYEQWGNELSFKVITFRVPVSKVQKFSEKNNIKVNVYTTDSMITPRFYTLYCGSKMYDKTVSLLLVSNETEKHYCYIKNLSRLLRFQKTKHKETNIVCENCLNYKLHNDENYMKHFKICRNNGMGTIVTSSKPFIEFENHHKKMRIPYVIYAVFETILEAVDVQNVVSGKTIKDVEHVPSSFAIYIKSIYKDDISEPLYFYRGPNADSEFKKVITIVAKNIYWL